MKAIVKADAAPGLVMADVPEPEMGPNEVRIQTQLTSICGTDLHIDRWDDWAQGAVEVPMTIGHEFTGTVLDVGEDVADIGIGDRVSGEGHITCGHCRNCRAGQRNFCRNHVAVGISRPGAFAEQIVLPSSNVFVVPPHISDEVAAILDPLGNATHTTLAYDMVGEDVLITGAGPIGVMSVAIARHVGARHVVITDINPHRLELADGVGPSRTVNVATTELTEVMDGLGMTEGFDIGLEMSGSEQALEQLLSVMNHGGRVAILGIPAGDVTLPIADIIFKGLTVRGIYGRRIFETWYKMSAMLQSGLEISSVITHRFDADDYRHAFDTVASGQAGKVLLRWSD